MSSKKKVSLTARITEDEYNRLESMANVENITLSALVKLFVSNVLNGDIVIEKGELKMGVDPIGYAVSEDDLVENLRYKELRFDKLMGAFEKKGYTDKAIRQTVELMISQVYESPNFNARRSREDWGA